jgi:GDP-4-dehydro-6-deoxy-D-mannose reductase
MVTGRILVTGASGFAGGHLLDVLAGAGAPLVGWHGPDRRPASRPAVRWAGVDVRDRQAVQRALADARPSRIFHCAGVAHVAESWRQTTATLEVNALGTHHLLDAARTLGLDARIIVPSSGLIYRPSTNPIGEDDPLGPTTPYGLSKLAQELVARAAIDDGLTVLVARPFNHIGPRQDPGFVVSSFARQIARAEAGLAEPVIHVGNLEARRDVTDVRDAVRAYVTIAEAGVPGRVYNVCTGRAPRVADLLEGLLALARIPMEVHVDDVRLRPSDTPVLLGDPTRIRTELGWTASIPISETLADVLDDWRRTIP